MKKTESISFLADDGTEVECGSLEQTTINGRNYLLVSDETGSADDDDLIVYIMRETGGSEDDMVSYEIVEDDEELSAVSKVFEQLMEEINIEV